MSHAPRRAVLAILCATSALAQAPDASIAHAPDLHPTAEETEVLCWVNRFRRDPAAFARLVLEGNLPENAAHVDWEMFTAELAALSPSPPVFFEPRLIQASRAHARYMVEAREYGHHETEGRPGFTGEWPEDRARAAGYPHKVAECSWARGDSPLAIVACAVVDAGEPGSRPGGMQERRGHRRCMIDPKWREVGIGLFAWGDGLLSNVQLYGDDKGLGRVLGGVAIDDRDSDVFYDVGEGLGGVHVRVGARGAVTCGSGAFRLDLPLGEGGELVARLGPLELVRRIEPGADNVQVDLCFDVALAVAALESKLARPEVAAAQQRALRLELLELRTPASPDELALAEEVATLKAEVLAGLGTGTRAEAAARHRAGKRVFAGTVVEVWLDDAETADGLVRAAALAREIESAKRRATRMAVAAADLERALAEVQSPDLWHLLAALRWELRR